MEGKRLIIVVTFGWLFILFGVFSLLRILIYSFFLPIDALKELSVSSFSPIFDTGTIFVGINLLKYKNWARIVTLILCIAFIVTMIYLLLTLPVNSENIFYFVLFLFWILLFGSGFYLFTRPKIKEQHLINLLLIVLIAEVFSGMYWSGRILMLKTYLELKEMGAVIYGYVMVVLSTVRELAPITAAISTSFLAPFFIVLYKKQNERLWHRRFIIILIACILFASVLGIYAALTGAYFTHPPAKPSPLAVSVGIGAIDNRDILDFTVKNISFIFILWILGFSLAKALLNKERLKYKLIFVFACMIAGAILVLITDIALTFIIYKIGW